jgi:TolB protein
MRNLAFALVLAGAILLAALFAAARPAHATFPGTNGLIAFASDRYGNTINIFTMPSTGGAVTQLTDLTADQGAAITPAWSPDGKQIVFSERDANNTFHDLYLMNANGSNQHLLRSEPAGFHDEEPSFSPDGKQVVFERCNFANEECAIYSINSNGRGLTAITHFNQTVNVFDVHPRYSPDGNTIAFGSFNRGGVQGGIYSMSKSGTRIHLLTPTALEPDGRSDWAPDGSTIALNSNCCNAQPQAIWAMHPDGSGLKQLTTPGTENDNYPSYSPDGTKLVFERDAADFSTSSIYTMNADGSSTPIDIQDNAFQPAWGPAPSG